MALVVDSREFQSLTRQWTRKTLAAAAAAAAPAAAAAAAETCVVLPKMVMLPLEKLFACLAQTRSASQSFVCKAGAAAKKSRIAPGSSQPGRRTTGTSGRERRNSRP